MLLSRIVKLMGTRFNKEIEETLERERSNGTDGVIIEASVCLYDHFIFFFYFFSFLTFHKLQGETKREKMTLKSFFYFYLFIKSYVQ
jgi:hypothetical protein